MDKPYLIIQNAANSVSEEPKPIMWLRSDSRTNEEPVAMNGAQKALIRMFLPDQSMYPALMKITLITAPTKIEPYDPAKGGKLYFICTARDHRHLQVLLRDYISDIPEDCYFNTQQLSKFRHGLQMHSVSLCFETLRKLGIYTYRFPAEYQVEDGVDLCVPAAALATTVTQASLLSRLHLCMEITRP